MHRHVGVNVKDFAVDDETTETTNQTLFDGELLQEVAAMVWLIKYFIYSMLLLCYQN